MFFLSSFVHNICMRKSEAFEKRIHEIDLFRGFLILLVIFDHLMWFFNFYIFHNQHPFLNWYWTSTLRYTVRQIVLMAFLFTCGISCHLSRSNKKRGFLLLFLCLGVTIATHILQLLPMLSNRAVCIDFNILGVICLSILAYAACEKLSSRDLWFISGILMAFYFFIILASKMDTSTEYNPFKSILYVPFNPIRAAYVGDYLPLFPYIIFLFFGVILLVIFTRTKLALSQEKEVGKDRFVF